MNTPPEIVSPVSTTLTPIKRRLLNNPLLSRGRGALVMSRRKRERSMRNAQERQDFLKEHPWYGEIEGYQREIIRRMTFGLNQVGRKIEGKRLRSLLFTVGDCLGKEAIWPILNHLLDGGVFHSEGLEFCGDRPNTKQLPSVPLLPFLETHVPEGARPVRLLLIEMLLKAQARAEDLIRSALQDKDESAIESSSVAASQIPPRSGDVL